MVLHKWSGDTGACRTSCFCLCAPFFTLQFHWVIPQHLDFQNSHFPLLSGRAFQLTFQLQWSLSRSLSFILQLLTFHQNFHLTPRLLSAQKKRSFLQSGPVGWSCGWTLKDSKTTCHTKHSDVQAASVSTSCYTFGPESGETVISLLIFQKRIWTTTTSALHKIWQFVGVLAPIFPSEKEQLPPFPPLTLISAPLNRPEVKLWMGDDRADCRSKH